MVQDNAPLTKVVYISNMEAMVAEQNEEVYGGCRRVRHSYTQRRGDHPAVASEQDSGDEKDVEEDSRQMVVLAAQGIRAARLYHRAVGTEDFSEERKNGLEADVVGRGLCVKPSDGGVE